MSTDLTDRLVQLLEHAVRASDAEVALHALTALRRELDAFERVQAWRALDAGSSWSDVMWDNCPSAPNPSGLPFNVSRFARQNPYEQCCLKAAMLHSADPA